ncbi:CPBP family intramembrane metalloprotease [Paenibacillus sp. P26]|nr:CPBP family intramembrane metalloprotease [Paenibacillus sp. P26]UUZ92643.1 CPBP family intramembrane metalloprotease [Paenibacillus sp. P25]
MNRYVLGLAPALLVAFGLYAGHSVVLTFVLFYSWLGAVPLLDYLVFRKQSLTRMIGDWGLSANARQTIAGMGLGLSCLIILLVGAYDLRDLLFDTGRLRSLLEAWNFSGDRSVLLLLVLVLLNPVLEEIYWRGYLYRRMGEPLVL